MTRTIPNRHTLVGRSGAAAAALLVAACLLATSRPAAAGPWGRDLGSAYIKAGFTYYSADESFNQGVSTGQQYTAFTYNIYADIGLPHRFSMVVDLPYVVARNESTSGFTYGNNTLGDARFELDFQLFEGIPVALGVETKVPLYDAIEDQATDALLDVDGRLYPADNFPAVGDANVDVTPKVLAGYSFNQFFPGWLTAELGYRIRTGDFADSIWGSLSFGSFVWPEHIALGVYANGNINVQDDPNPDEVRAAETLYVQGYMLITGAPWVPDLGLTFSVGGIVSAVNSSQGMDFGVGLSYDI